MVLPKGLVRKQAIRGGAQETEWLIDKKLKSATAVTWLLEY